jgi:hypothetical protein
VYVAVGGNQTVVGVNVPDGVLMTVGGRGVGTGVGGAVHAHNNNPKSQNRDFFFILISTVSGNGAQFSSPTNDSRGIISKVL